MVPLKRGAWTPAIIISGTDAHSSALISWCMEVSSVGTNALVTPVPARAGSVYVPRYPPRRPPVITASVLKSEQAAKFFRIEAQDDVGRTMMQRRVRAPV